MIAFDRVTFRHADRTVLRDVSFTIERGECVALVGRSGAGKSTALKLIIRLLEPSSGSVSVDGRNTHAWDPFELRRRTGYVLQDVGLFPHMSVSENVGIVPRLDGWPPERRDARVRDLLELVGVGADEYAERRPHELSGGQRQRVGVARALAVDPPVLLMDEPFGALDPVTRAELHREFARIQSRVRKTVLLVTHDMREAFSLADRVGVLDEGQLVALDAPAALQASTHPAVRALVESMSA